MNPPNTTSNLPQNAPVNVSSTDYRAATESQPLNPAYPVTTPNPTSVVPPTRSRLSWGSILAGALIALTLEIIFGLFGIGVGASSIHPLNGGTDGHGLGMGAAIWTILSALVSLFVGGYVAGRLANVPRSQDSVWHGLLVFGVVTLLSLYLIGSAVGRMVSGVGSLAAQSASAIGQGVSQAAPSLLDAGKQVAQQNGINPDTLRQQIEQTLQQTGKPELQPGNLQNQAQQAASEARGTAQQTAQNPNAANQDVAGLIGRLFQQGQSTVNAAADRDSLINVVVARTGKSREEAAQQVDNWTQAAQQTKQKLQQVGDQTQQKAKEIGEDAAQTTAKAGTWTAIGLLVGAIAAALGGIAGAPATHHFAPPRSVAGRPRNGETTAAGPTPTVGTPSGRTTAP